jgi:hypothetical protein
MQQGADTQLASATSSQSDSESRLEPPSTDTIFSATPLPSSTPLHPLLPPSASETSLASPAQLKKQADLLQTCTVDIQALNTANGLRDVISQVESGQVQRIRDLYGPKPMKTTATTITTITTTPTVKWKNIKGTITKRERIYEQFDSQFKKDKNRFFNFFIIQDTSRKRKHKGGDEELQAMRKVVEAIPRCKADVKSEMKRQIYLDSSGQFSDELWAQKWAGKNHWEVWRELGKEWY